MGTWGEGAGSHQLCLDASVKCPIRLLNHWRNDYLLPLPLFFTRARAGITHSLVKWINYSARTLPKTFNASKTEVTREINEIKIITVQSNEWNKLQ